MELVAEQNRNLISVQERKEFGKKIGFVVTLFGCRHGNLSRPFTYGRKSYRVCLKCGARKHFDTKTLTTYGAFYYPQELTRLN